MSTYSDFIAAARLVDTLDYTITTADADYPGTAVEICDADQKELFCIVIGPTGKLEVLFLENDTYRIPLETLEATLLKAKRDVRLPRLPEE
jgi:hypothetical protein